MNTHDKIELPEHDCLYESTNEQGYIDLEPAYRKSTVLRLLEADRQRRGEQVARLVALYDAAKSKYRAECSAYYEGQADAYDMAIQIVESAGPQPAAPVVKESLTVAEPVKVLGDARIMDAVESFGVACRQPHITAAEQEIRLHEIRALLARYGQPVAQTEPCTNTYVQTVPDQCDRIVWRGRYYHLHDGTDPVAQEPMAYAVIAANTGKISRLVLADDYDHAGLSEMRPEHVIPLISAAPVAAQPSVPDILFDGWAVLQAMDEKARERTLAIHVSDVLDAVVRMMRAAPPADGQAQQDADKVAIRDDALQEAEEICLSMQPWGNGADDWAAENLRIAASKICALKSKSAQQAPRQYFYAATGCHRCRSTRGPDCICWHDYGTGPLADTPEQIKSWRYKPTQQGGQL